MKNQGIGKEPSGDCIEFEAACYVIKCSISMVFALHTCNEPHRSTFNISLVMSSKY